MLVVLAIIVTVTAVVITSQSAFNKTLILANTAYDVALSLRSAQTYGLGSRTAGITANAGYGLHFDASTPNTFTLFADTSIAPGGSACHPTSDASAPTAQPGDCVYEESEKITTYTLGNGIFVNDFCAHTAVYGWSCTSNDGGPRKLDIVFARPNPEPLIAVGDTYYQEILQACLELVSPQGGARYVSVTASGAIMANATSCL